MLSPVSGMGGGRRICGNGDFDFLRPGGGAEGFIRRDYIAIDLFGIGHIDGIGKKTTLPLLMPKYV